MQLTIFSADEKTYFMEIGSEMALGDLLALVGAEADEDPDHLLLYYNSVQLEDKSKSLASYGMTGNEELLRMASMRPQASSSSSSAQGGPSNIVDDVERMRLTMLGNPDLMAQIRSTRPEFADAVMNSPTRFAELMKAELDRRQDLEGEKKRQTELLNADPYDVEAQRKIEEAIRQEAVLENMEHAMEYSPESFGNVCMLYIDVEVNGHKVKAFVDSGAQSTIISPDCAEKCGIMRLLDTRFAGMARGVGTAKILGRVHSAQIRMGDLHLPVAFSVLEGKDVDLLFGLDMLKRHQACIDLEKNCLRIQGREIRFLSEHELPKGALGQGEELAPVEGVASGSGGGKFPGEGNALGASGGGSGSGGGGQAQTQTQGGGVTAASFPESDIMAIMNLGVSREQAIQTLEAAGGNGMSISDS